MKSRIDLIQISNAFGRFALASLFLLGGVNKAMNFEAVSTRMEAVGLVPSPILLPIVIALELGAGLLIAMAGPFYRLAALVLAGFTLTTNLFFHDFWTMQGDLRELELSLFFKNIAIAGALLFVATQQSSSYELK
jgi:putative oxidoreductase